MHQKKIKKLPPQPEGRKSTTKYLASVLPIRDIQRVELQWDLQVSKLCPPHPQDVKADAPTVKNEAYTFFCACLIYFPCPAT